MDVIYFHTYVDIRVNIKANSVIYHQFIVYFGNKKTNYHTQKIKKTHIISFIKM